MLQMVSLIATLAQKPEGLTNDALSQFNGARNTLLAAYDSATKAAESSAIKDALAAALDADSVVYYDIAGATQDRMQKSITAVSSVITACGASGIDLASIFNAKQ